MRTTLTVISLLVLTGVFAQKPVQQQLLPWINNTSALPQSTAEVKSKCYNATEGFYDVTKVAGPLPARLGQTIQQINSDTASSAYAMPDTAGIADVQKMTPEQQQAWAMQYAQKQQAAAATNNKVPSGAENAFYQEYVHVNSTITPFMDSMNTQFSRLLAENEAKQKHFVEQREEMINICPMINGGGGGEGDDGHDPTCVKKAERNYQEWVAAWATEWFSKVSAFLTKKKSEMNAQFGKGEKMIVDNHYFLNTTNDRFTKDAGSFQLLEINAMMGLELIIEKTWKTGFDMDNNIRLSHERCGETY